MKDKPNNRGEVMLKSLVVYTITIFLLFFILAIFSALYQRWNVQTISNETAARYAQTFRFSDKDVLSGYVTKDQLVAVKEYRYLGNSLEDSAKKEVNICHIRNSTGSNINYPMVIFGKAG